MSKLVYFDMVEAVSSTPNGLWVDLFDYDRDVFVPYSQIDPSSEVRQEADVGRLVVTAWWARENGLRATPFVG